MSVEPTSVSSCNKSCNWRFFKTVTLMDMDTTIRKITVAKPGKLPPQRANTTYVDGTLEALYVQFWNAIGCQFNIRWRLFISPIVSTAHQLTSIVYVSMSDEYESAFMIIVPVGVIVITWLVSL
eukprot:GHVN01027115.1.p1 GENE.GHVN01027115.1~~GHVN01027115.1.p1  ORF type:complete len:124 (+),score=1.76 GHVN01027115.1:658-1029(+)